MHARGQFEEVEKYFLSNRAGPVPQADLEKLPSEVFYPLIHVVHKESSTITQI